MIVSEKKVKGGSNYFSFHLKKPGKMTPKIVEEKTINISSQKPIKETNLKK